MFNTQFNAKGFTLIETLVSILIFSLSITALLVITSGGVSDTNFARKKQAAYLLAQEGIELVRFARDTEMRFGGGWSSFIAGVNACMTPAGCTIDADALVSTGGVNISSCGGSCPPLLYGNTTGGYGYISGLPSDFVRTINIKNSPGSNPEEAVVVSTVEYEHGGTDFEIVMSETITGWVRLLP